MPPGTAASVSASITAMSAAASASPLRGDEHRGNDARNAVKPRHRADRGEELSVPEFCALACAGVSLLILADSSAAARRRRAVFANRLKIRRNKQQEY